MSELSNINTIKELMARHGVRFSKAMGQNFLTNPSVCPEMAEYAVEDGTKGVLEIGPGIGVLTRELAEQAQKVVAVELDKRLLPVLAETLEKQDNVKIISGDVLKLDLHRLLEEEFAGMEVAVCANLPYYITSPIVMRLLEERLPLTSITVMVQKEAAQRLCAKVGSRQSGAVTVAVQYYAEPEILFSVSRGSFMPPPNVDSAVIRLKVRKQPPIAVTDEALLFKIVKAAFGQRRKTVWNALSAGLSLSKDKVKESLDNAEIPPMARAEQLTMEEFGRLAEAFHKI